MFPPVQDAISGFMVQVQELRAEDTTKAARITSLQQDLEESSRELCSSTTRNDQLVRLHVASILQFLLETGGGCREYNLL